MNIVETIDAMASEFIKTNKNNGGGVNWDSERNFILQAVNANKKIHQATPGSLKNAILNIAITGLSISPLCGHAYLECRSDKISKKPDVWQTNVSLKINYKGQIKTLTDSGSVKWIRADVVRTGDTFVYHGPAAMPDINVEDVFSTGRSEVVGAYAIAELPGGGILCEIMRTEELAEVEAASKANFGPWKNTFRSEMCKKSVINRLVKTIPKTERSESVLAISAQSDGFDFDTRNRPEQDVISDDQYKKLLDQVAASGGDKVKWESYMKTVFKGAPIPAIPVSALPMIQQEINRRAGK